MRTMGQQKASLQRESRSLTKPVQNLSENIVSAEWKRKIKSCDINVSSLVACIGCKVPSEIHIQIIFLVY